MKDRTIIIPKIEKKLTIKEKILKLLRQKDHTSSELSLVLNIGGRRIREAIQELKQTHIIIETKCRCGQTPIYEVK